MNVPVASDAWICCSFVQPSEARFWTWAWIWSWDPLGCATPSVAPPQPRPGKTRQGKTPKRASAAPSHDSNARIKHESQSNLSNIVAPRQHKPATDSGILQAYSRFREMATDHRWKRRFRHHRSESGSGPSLHGPDFLYRRKNEARRRKNAQWSGDSQNFFDVRNEPRNEQQVSEPSPKT